jgi:hypothetical protein
MDVEHDLTNDQRSRGRRRGAEREAIIPSIEFGGSWRPLAGVDGHGIQTKDEGKLRRVEIGLCAQGLPVNVPNVRSKRDPQRRRAGGGASALATPGGRVVGGRAVVLPR